MASLGDLSKVSILIGVMIAVGKKARAPSSGQFGLQHYLAQGLHLFHTSFMMENEMATHSSILA